MRKPRLGTVLAVAVGVTLLVLLVALFAHEASSGDGSSPAVALAGQLVFGAVLGLLHALWRRGRTALTPPAVDHDNGFDR
jgi:hypothetical protein